MFWHFRSIKAREQIRGGDAEDELLATRELELFTPRVRLVVVGRGLTAHGDSHKVGGERREEAPVRCRAWPAL